jgi:predicted MFS family arabinose efflux permease
MSEPTDKSNDQPPDVAEETSIMPDKQPTDGEDDEAMAGQFDLPVDPDQGFKASQLKICSFKRPHMRAFHYSWWSFFIAFFIWFSIAPLLPEVRDTLDLSKGDIWITNIVAVSGDIVMRFVFGAVCDKYGARRPMAAVLMMAAIPTACTGAVNSLVGLAILRLFIGIAGSSFAMCQCWSTRMVSNRRFSEELLTLKSFSCNIIDSLPKRLLELPTH